MVSKHTVIFAKKIWNKLMRIRPSLYTAVVFLFGFSDFYLSRIVLLHDPNNTNWLIAFLFGALLMILSMRWWHEETPREDTMFHFDIEEDILEIGVEK